MNGQYNIHRSEDRGGGNYGWLDTKHAFSFAHYYNPDRMGFGALRVINEDLIAPNSGFSIHPHQDMEIVSVVTEGALSHKDTEGNEGVIPVGVVQKMSAGKGIYHSEMNLSKNERVHLFQIWIDTKENGIKADYEEFQLPMEDRLNKLTVVASGYDDRTGKALYIHQNAEILLGHLDSRNKTYHVLKESGHGAYIQVINGNLDVNGYNLKTGDAVEVNGLNKLNFSAPEGDVEFLTLDVPISNYLDPRTNYRKY